MIWLFPTSAALLLLAAPALADGIDTAVPNVAAIQAAYEAASKTTTKAHEKDLEIRDAQCPPGQGATVACSINFTSRADKQDRLYFTIVRLAKADTAWELTSGLCR
jgi:hypothetical protein